MKQELHCHSSCEIGSNCFGGYLSEIGTCNNEFVRLKQMLAESGQYSAVVFAPSPKQLQFLVNDSSGVTRILIVDGYIDLPEPDK